MSGGTSGIYSKDFAVCPWCDAKTDSEVSHLYEDKDWKTFGPWYCSSCKGAYTGTIHAPGNVTLERAPEAPRISRSMALLRLAGEKGPVYFVMDHDRYHGRPGEEVDNQEHQRYVFEEHSCPTNWLRECVAVIKDGHPDPHGFLSFVRAVDVPLDVDEDDDANWEILFPEAFGA